MSDLFHESLLPETIAEILSVCGLAPQHVFQVLTKRPQRMKDIIADIVAVGCVQPPKNLWLGVSVEDQETADERIPLLLQTPASVRWVSYEPALGQLDLFPFLYPTSCCQGIGTHDITCMRYGKPKELSARLDWIVAGGESGPNARSSHPDWFRAVRDQCQQAGVPFFFKQWGEWQPWRDVRGFANTLPIARVPRGPAEPGMIEWIDMARVGKKHAGRLLDGREWNEFPVVSE